MTVRTEDLSFLDVQVRDAVAFLTFNRPTWALAEEWEIPRVLDDIRDDDDIRAIVLTGRGDDFCGGAHHGDDPFDAAGYYDRSLEIFGRWVNLDKPVVVAINGRIGGSGLTFAMFGDIVIAERQVPFRDAHVLGGVVSATGPYQWPPSIGLMQAKRYLLTGDEFTADQALAMGLITEVVEQGQSLARATEFAAKVAAIRPAAIQGTKRALNQWLRMAWGPVFQTALSLEFMRFPEEYAARTRAGSS